jgi:hypothetical protein
MARVDKKPWCWVAPRMAASGRALARMNAPAPPYKEQSVGFFTHLTKEPPKPRRPSQRLTGSDKLLTFPFGRKGYIGVSRTTFSTLGSSTATFDKCSSAAV